MSSEIKIAKPLRSERLQGEGRFREVKRRLLHRFVTNGGTREEENTVTFKIGG